MTIPRKRAWLDEPHRHPVARCACGRSYSADAWAALPWHGDQPQLEGEPVLELRGCVCGSTISRERSATPLVEGGLVLEVRRR